MILKTSLILCLLFIQSSFSFVPVYKETQIFKVSTSKQYASNNNPQFCKFETSYNKEKEQVELRMGVVGSPVAHFGWNMALKLSELPLKSGWTQEFGELGTTKMIATYDGVVLKFSKKKGEEVWNRLYPFSLNIDPDLQNPGIFKGNLEGYEKTVFGFLRKHVVSSCNFKNPKP